MRPSEERWQIDRSQRIASALPLVASTLLIYYASSVPANDLPQTLFTGWDKLVHTCAFLVFGFVVLLAITGWRPWWTLHRIRLTAFALSATYGIVDEIHQMFVPGRDSNLYDWGADLLGISLALLLSRSLYRMFRDS